MINGAKIGLCLFRFWGYLCVRLCFQILSADLRNTPVYQNKNESLDGAGMLKSTGNVPGSNVWAVEAIISPQVATNFSRGLIAGAA